MVTKPAAHACLCGHDMGDHFHAQRLTEADIDRFVSKIRDGTKREERRREMIERERKKRIYYYGCTKCACKAYVPTRAKSEQK